MTPLDRLRHLLAMAAADNRMNEAELGFLSERAVELGVTEDEFHQVLQDAVKGEIQLPIPTAPAERRALLKDLILMMAADGDLEKREKEMFASVAVAMDMTAEDMHKVIDATIAENP